MNIDTKSTTIFDHEKTAMIGNIKGDLVKVKIPIDTEKSPTETTASFRKRVGTSYVLDINKTNTTILKRSLLSKLARKLVLFDWWLASKCDGQPMGRFVALNTCGNWVCGDKSTVVKINNRAYFIYIYLLFAKQLCHNIYRFLRQAIPKYNIF